MKILKDEVDMLKITLIRHGQTDSNIRMTYLGRTDVPLNDTGIKQAKKLAKFLQKEKIDALYVSPLQRAMQTAQEISKQNKNNKNINIKMNYSFQERDFGLWDDLTMDEIKERYPEESTKWLEDWIEYQVPNGESSSQTYKRVQEAYKKVIDKHTDGEHIMIVSHLGIIRYLIGCILDIGVEKSWCFCVDNCSITTIEIKDNKPVLTELNKIV